MAIFPFDGQVAQLVEQRTENPRVGGSIPPLATIKLLSFRCSFFEPPGSGAVTVVRTSALLT